MQGSSLISQIWSPKVFSTTDDGYSSPKSEKETDDDDTDDHSLKRNEHLHVESKKPSKQPNLYKLTRCLNVRFYPSVFYLWNFFYNILSRMLPGKPVVCYYLSPSISPLLLDYLICSDSSLETFKQQFKMFLFARY